VESAFGWILKSGGRLYVGTFGKNPSSVTVKKFSPLIYCIKKFYKCSVFGAICKDNAAINVLLFNTKSVIHVNFDGSCASK
jgi:hypothetical protein